MQLISLEDLGWLHDAVVFSIAYDASDESSRSVKLTMRCNDEAGYPPWNGKDLVLIAVDVAVMTFVGRGAIIGPETFDQAYARVSDTLHESVVESQRMYPEYPRLEFSMCFHSGSEIEIICKNLQVEVLS
jgi:hypothetical protein